MTTEAAPYTITVDQPLQQFNPLTQRWETHMVQTVIPNPALRCMKDDAHYVSVSVVALLVVVCIVSTWIIRGWIYGK